jgi:hypothetical protein
MERLVGGGTSILALGIDDFKDSRIHPVGLAVGDRHITNAFFLPLPVSHILH